MSSNECAGLQTQYDVFSLDKAETLALLHGLSLIHISEPTRPY